MANWAEVEMAVILPSRNKDRFLGFFLDPDGSNDRKKGKQGYLIGQKHNSQVNNLSITIDYIRFS